MFATGVTVVTSAGQAGPCGVTANSFSSVSLVPPLVLVCLHGRSGAAAVIARNQAFVVNVLSWEQEALAQRFASSGRLRGDRSFAGVATRAEATGSPIFAGVACWLDCALAAMLAAGDHLVVIGEVLDYEARLRARAARFPRWAVPRRS